MKKKPPAPLIAAFREVADREIESVAALLVDDGFDAETMRVLAAWPQLEHGWREPKKPCPDGGVLPTPAAWRWLCSGHGLDAVGLADAAGVSIAVARAKAAVILGNRLVMPDGTLTKPARAALSAHARRALGIKANAGKGNDGKRDRDQGAGGGDAN